MAEPAGTLTRSTAFVHVIDAASLALIVPILQRGLRERSADVKKTAAQITGNMYVCGRTANFAARR